MSDEIHGKDGLPVNTFPDSIFIFAVVCVLCILIIVVGPSVLPGLGTIEPEPTSSSAP